MLPRTESLKTTIDRVLPFWYDNICPAMLAGEKIIVAAHGNSLRAIIKHVKNISEKGKTDRWIRYCAFEHPNWRAICLHIRWELELGEWRVFRRPGWDCQENCRCGCSRKKMNQILKCSLNNPTSSKKCHLSITLLSVSNSFSRAMYRICWNTWSYFFCNMINS